VVLSPGADGRAAEEGWFAGRPGLRLEEAPGPGWRALVDDGAVRGAVGSSARDDRGAVVRPVSSDSWVAAPGEIALACAGRPAPGEAARARAAGLRVLWLATGRELATPGALDEWQAAGCDALHLWSHAATSDAHDFHAGVAGRFVAITAAIRRARAAGISVAVSSMLTRSSAPVLASLPRWLCAEGVAAWRVAGIDSDARLLHGAGVGPHDGLLGRLSVALPHALQALSWAARSGLPTFISGAPACLLGPFAAAALPGPARVFAPTCAACPARAGCCGVAPDYLERFGGAELRAANLRALGSPVAGPRWMFIGTGLLRHVEIDMVESTGAKGQPRIRLPVLTGAGDDG
jgi:hypothetical protein